VFYTYKQLKVPGKASADSSWRRLLGQAFDMLNREEHMSLNEISRQKRKSKAKAKVMQKTGM
jgi:hypothetical protein